MPSETQRIAKALVESRTETFATKYSREQSSARLAEALKANRPRTAKVTATWRVATEGLRLDVQLSPAPTVRIFLVAASVALTMLLVSSAWVLLAADKPMALRFLVPLTAVLGILGLPLLIVGLGSQREAEEAKLSRAIRHALLDEREFPKPLGDED
jgi:hypothetical protein